MTTNDDRTPDDEWVSVNDHLDYHLGFVSSGIADDIERRFGVFPVFANASGWIAMVLRLETGHVVLITDMDATHLTPTRDRTPEIGFTVGIYTAAQYESGDSQWVLSEQVDACGLVDLIARALTNYAADHRHTTTPAMWAQALDLGAPGTFAELAAESPEKRTEP